MKTILFISILVVIVYLFKKSKSNFFYQNKKTLLKKRNHLIANLEDYNINTNIDLRWLRAYDFFVKNPHKFDGATIVADSYTINGYDASAGNHDFAYIFNKWWSFQGFINKIKYDWQYGKDKEALNVHSFFAYSQAILLIMTTPLWYGYLLFKK